MAADYTDSKSALGAALPEYAVESDWNRVEPLISSERLKQRFLFGIPLMSRFADPVTKRRDVMTPEIVRQFIVDAVAVAEAEIHVEIFPVKRREKYAFDQNHYREFGYLQLTHTPVSSIDRLSVTPSNNVDIYDVPLDWIEVAYLPRGQINIVPLTIAIQNGGFIAAQTGGGAAFLSILGMRGWIPAFWQVEYSTGWVDGQIPKLVNELIGIIAAMDILDQLAATNAHNSGHSLGIDGLSQSASTPGPEVYSKRLEGLEKKRALIVGKLKAKFQKKIFSSHV